MNKIKNILKFGGLFLIALGYILPWYSWNVELVKDRVVSSLFGAGTTISGLQFIIPQTLVRAVPSSSAQYFVFQGLTPAGVLEEIGLTWSMVPALVLVLFIVFWGLLFVTRGQARPAIREGVVPLAIGGSILLALLLWNPAPPPSLAKIELVPAGKFIPILGSVLLALAGLIHLLGRNASAQAPKFHILLLAGLVLVTLPGCSDKNSLALDKSFTLAEFGTLQYPKSWSQIQDPPYAILGPDSISITKTDMYVSIQALAEYENASAAVQSMISKYSVLKGPEPYQLDGSDGFFVEYEGGGPNGAFQYHDILIVAPHPTSGKLVGIWLSAKVENWSAFSPTALAMIDTFKWAR